MHPALYPDGIFFPMPAVRALFETSQTATARIPSSTERAAWAAAHNVSPWHLTDAQVAQVPAGPALRLVKNEGVWLSDNALPPSGTQIYGSTHDGLELDAPDDDHWSHRRQIVEDLCGGDDWTSHIPLAELPHLADDAAALVVTLSDDDLVLNIVRIMPVTVAAVDYFS